MAAPREVAWHETMADAEPHVCVPVASTDPLLNLQTSGMTCQAKGMGRDDGGMLRLNAGFPFIADDGCAFVLAGLAHAEIVADSVFPVRHELGPIACFEAAAVAGPLPKTWSESTCKARSRRSPTGSPSRPPPPSASRRVSTRSAQGSRVSA